MGLSSVTGDLRSMRDGRFDLELCQQPAGFADGHGADSAGVAGVVVGADALPKGTGTEGIGSKRQGSGVGDQGSAHPRQRFNRRDALHRVKGRSSGYKPCEMAASEVASRGDTYLAGSLFEMFRLRRVFLFEAWGCGDLAVFLESALILHWKVV